MNLAMIKEKIREDHDNKLFLKKVGSLYILLIRQLEYLL